jgi:WD40 repeat protein
VQIYELGTLKDVLFCSMEWMEGGDLAAKLAGNPQPFHQAASILQTLAEAMHYAHQSGIIHRDLKPANVLLTIDGTLKITDFGLAKKLDETGPTGEVMGTPSYLAPEQAQGKKDVGPLADVWALGAMLYEMLTGRPPFRAATVLETLEQIRLQEPVPPSRLQPKVPRDVETICLKCLRKDPRQRYATAAELAEDLDRFRTGRPIQARPVSPVERALKWSKRNPILASATALVLVSVVAAFVLIDQARRKADRAATGEKQQRIEASRAAARASSDLGWQHAAAGNPATGLLWMARALREAPEEDWALERTLRTALSGWMKHVHPLDAVFQHSGPVLAGAFSPDGRLVVTVGEDDHTFTLWRLADKERVASARLPFPCRILFSPDSGLVGAIPPTATANDLAGNRLPDGAVLLESVTGTEARAWPADSAWHARRKEVGARWQPCLMLEHGATVLHGEDGQVRARWNAVHIRDVEPSRPAASGQLTAQASHLPTGSILEAFLDRAVRIRRGKGGESLSLPHQSEVLAALFSRDGKLLLTGAYDGSARLWDATSGQPLGAPLAHGRDVTAVGFSPDGRLLLTTSRDGTARVWRVSPGAQPMLTLHQGSPVFAATFRPDGAVIATAGGPNYTRKDDDLEVLNNRGVYLWDVRTGKRTRTLQCPGLLRIAHVPQGFPQAFGVRRAGQDHTQVRSLAFSPDGHFLAAGVGFPPEHPWIGAVHLLDAERGRWVGPPLRHLARVNSLAFSPDGRHLASCTYDGDAWLWDYKTGEVVRKLFDEEQSALPILALAFSPDGQAVATAGYDRTVRFREAATGREIRTRLQHAGAIHALSFSSEGKRIVTGSSDRTAQVWNVSDGTPLGPPMQHPGEVLAVAFSPDGKAILTGSDDGTARLWDAGSAMPLAPPWKHRGPVHVVSFSPTGEHILSASSDGTACVRELPASIKGSPAEVMQEVERMTGLRITESGNIRPLGPADLGP